MTYKLKLNQVREILGMEVKFESAKLVDGTVLEYERLEPGFPVLIVAADGSKSPAPAGEHVLEDGTNIELDEAGLIVEVSAAGEEGAEAVSEAGAEAPIVEVSGAAEDAAPIEEPKIDVAMEDAIIEKVTDKITETMKAVFAAVEEVAQDVASVKEEMSAMKTKMEKFSKAPAAAPIAKVATAKVVDDIDSIDVKLAAIKNAMKK
jgi:hypothetical protein